MDKRYKGEWLTRSDIPNRKERLEAHLEFERSELKQKLDAGWKVESARMRPRRPRIQRPRQIVTIVFGKEVILSIRLYEEKYKHLGFKVVREIL